jgi:hypothetical protein
MTKIADLKKEETANEITGGLKTTKTEIARGAVG